MDATSILTFGWRPLLVIANVEPFLFRALRHFHASNLVAHGANPLELQYEMGHHSVEYTLDIYAHLFAEDAEARKARIEETARDIV